MIRKKRKFLLFFFLLITVLTTNAITLAQSKEATTEVEANPTIDKINLFKEKIASKFAEFAESIEVTTDGIVDSIDEGLITLLINGEKKVINTNETTRYLLRDNRLKLRKVALFEFKPNDTITVIGSEQVNIDIITASLIVKAPATVFFAGKITEIDKQNFAFTIEEESRSYIFDYETFTQSLIYDKEKGELTTGKFSQLKPAALVQILALPQEKQENRYTTQRMIVMEGDAN